MTASPDSTEDVRVSYVLPTRNRLEFVRKILAARGELKGPRDELIVVDGGSTDGTYEYLRDAKPGLIDLLIHEPDRSEAHATNKGFLAARGRYLKSLSDDDVYFRDALEKAYATMDEHPEIDLLQVGGEFINQIDTPGNLKPFSFEWFPDDARLNDSYKFAGMCGEGMIIRRSSLAVIGLCDPRHLHADASLLCSATVRGACMRYLRVKGFSHRLGGQSVSRDSIRTRYVYRDYNFKGLSRWRYLTRPGEALVRALKRFGFLSAVPGPEPLWDGKLLS